jgi:adenosylcobinamide-phosphate synthase
MLIPWLSGHPGPFALFTVLLLAFALDAAFGDPAWLYKRVWHPVVVVGKAIGWAEARLNRAADAPSARRLKGGMLSLAVILVCAAIGFALTRLLAFPFGWVVEAVIASTLLAFRGLYEAVKTVTVELDKGLAQGRGAVADIVGRDPNALDEHGVARAAAESAAENFSDGVVAPIGWFALFGLPGLFAYKAINTLDSMIGHRNDRYRDFGRWAARIDDAANWPFARLSVLVIAAGSVVIGGSKPWRALTVAWRDAPKHRSPNAGWPEAALAGALGLALAGPRMYGREKVEDAWMGDGRAELTVTDLKQVLDLYVASGVVIAGLIGAGAFFL